MRKLIFVAFLAVLIAVAVTVPVYEVDRKQTIDEYGNFYTYYKLSDGTVFEQRGEIRNAGTPYQEIVITGYYAYVAPDGVEQLTEYVADKDGDHKHSSSGPGVSRQQKG